MAGGLALRLAGAVLSGSQRSTVRHFMTLAGTR
jgi:hypothetical protein